MTKQIDEDLLQRVLRLETKVCRLEERERDIEEDMSGEDCPCGGKYVETVIYDDWEGILHCNACNKKIRRYPKKLEEEPDYSPFNDTK